MEQLVKLDIMCHIYVAIRIGVENCVKYCNAEVILRLFNFRR